MSKESYKKFLKSVTLPHAKLGTIRKESDEATNLYNKYRNYLPMIYQGPTNRTERYTIYDGMQQDPIINWSLDILTDFITQSDNDLPFHIKYSDNEDLPESQTSILEQALKNWCDENEWKKRIYNTVRDILVYGDVVFIRDPETFELQKVNIYDVLGVVADELKNPTHYIIRNVELNVPLKVATQSKDDVTTQNMLNTLNTNFSAGSYLQGSKNLSNDPTNDQTTLPVDAKHIMHISLNVDNMFLYPFGLSTLEKVYKVYIQKMLLQDCVLLYRIKNATEKLVFNIPVGNIPKYKRKQYMEKIRNEMYQRRMPSKDSDGVFNTIDVAYNSIPLCEDFYLPVDGDGIQPKIEKLQGGQCLSLDTKIKLLDGRDLTLSEIINEYNNGKKLWVYSCNPETGEIAPGEITWAGVTRKNTEVMKLTLDNGEEIICTPDHKFPTLDKGTLHANEINVGQSLIPLYIRDKELKNNYGTKYQQFFDPYHKEWLFTHRVVAKYTNEEFIYDRNNNIGRKVIHHKDFNRFNNNLDNLVWMDAKDHWMYHSLLSKGNTEILKEWRKNVSDELLREIYLKQGESLRKYYNSLNGIEKENHIKKCKNNFMKGTLKVQNLIKNDKEWYNMRYHDWSNRLLEKFTEERGNKISQGLKENWSKNHNILYEKIYKNQKVKYSKKLLNILINIVKEANNKTIGNIVTLCIDSISFMDEYKYCNKDTKSPNFNVNNITKNVLRKIIKNHNYKNWKDFINKISNYNHKVVKIEYLPYKIDTGTITVDGLELIHGYHTFALSSGVFTFNSLGEIKDLTLWENDLIRGMQVPASWVPNGVNGDENSRNVSTNLANTYVQELRFYNYCKRLQNIMIKPFDEEFKKYLSDKGFLTGNTSFDLVFNDPTSIVDLTKAEIEANNLNTFSTAAGLPYISKQFALKKYLKLTEDEFNENKRLLILEQQDRFKSMDVKLPTEDSLQIPGLRSVDIDDIPMSYTEQLQGMNDMSGGMGGMPMGGDMSGGEMGGDMSGGMGAMGGADMSGGMGGADMGAVGMTGGEM